MRLRRLLAVTHEATITGAPMNLLHLLRWLVDHDVEVHTLIVRDGPLRHRFEDVGSVTVLDDGGAHWSVLGMAQQGLLALGSSRAWKPIAAARLRPQLRHLTGFDVAYLNSITSVGVLPFLPTVGVAVNAVHELQVAVRNWQPRADYELFRSGPDGWVAASDAVRQLLVGELGFPPERVSLHHEFIDARSLVDRVPDLRAAERSRRELGIPTDAAVVMGGGTLDWRKGPDLFVQLAAEVRRRTREPVSFVWVGGDRSGPDWVRLSSDRDRAGADHVHFIGTKPQPLDWYDLADVFALTSREDPYPLVCLEHAALAHPIVTYRNGGIVELLEAAGPEAALGIVDHLDVGAMADRVLDLLGSDRLWTAAGEQLRARVLDHHDVTVAAPRLVAHLESLLDRRD